MPRASTTSSRFATNWKPSRAHRCRTRRVMSTCAGTTQPWREWAAVDAREAQAVTPGFRLVTIIGGEKLGDSGESLGGGAGAALFLCGRLGGPGGGPRP